MNNKRATNEIAGRFGDISVINSAHIAKLAGNPLPLIFAKTETVSDP